MKGHDGGHALLEEGRGVEEGPVATQAHDEVDLVCQVVAFREGLQLVLKDRSGVTHSNFSLLTFCNQR